MSCFALSSNRLLMGCLVAALVAAAPPAGTAVAQRPTTAQQPIIINSVFSNIDYRTNTAVFKDIVVSQGDTRLSAERASATGVGFTNSQWTFAGAVVVTLQPSGTLRADQVVVQFRNGQVTGATATGSPAYFEQERTDSHRPVRGHADRITYEASQDTVHLYGHAQLSDQRSTQISAPVLVYSIRDERLQADSPGEKRGVHTTITPQ